MLRKLREILIILLPSSIVYLFFHNLILEKLWVMADDPGLGWHIKTGELILKTLRMPAADPFLLGGESLSWVSNQWLADVIIYVVYYMGSWPLLYGFVALGLTIALWNGLFLAQLRQSRAIVCLLVLFIFVFNTYYIHFFIRPVFFQLVFFILLSRILYGIHQNCQSTQTATNQSVHWPSLSLLFLIWANVHPSFVVGLGLLWLLFFCLLAERLDRLNILTVKQISQLFILAASCSLITGINPYFFKLHQSILHYMWGDNIRLQMEWRQLDFDSPAGLVWLILVVAFFSILFLARKNIRQTDLFPTLSVLPFMLLSCLAVRYLPFFGVIVFMSVAYLIQYLPKYLSNLCISSEIATRRCITVTRAALLLGLFSTAAVLGFHQQLMPAKVLGPSPETYPYQSITFLNTRHRASEINYGVLNDMDWGGFISMYGIGLKPAIDDRLFFFSSQYVTDYLDLMQNPTDQAYNKIISDQHEYILADPRKKFGKWLKQRFPERILFANERELLLH